MMIIGCDFHPSWQQVSWLDTETGETGEQKLVVEGRFPRIWMPSSEVRDLRQLLLHRYKLVIMRARVKNELQHLCLNKGVQRKHKLWSAAGQQILRELPLQPWAGRRRDDLLKLMAMLDQQIEPVGSGGQSRSSTRQNGAASSNPTRSRSDHGAGLRADPGRCQPLPARQAGGQLPGTDSASTPRADGRSWARSPSKATACCACCWWKRRRSRCVTIPSFVESICIAVTRSRKRWLKWQRRASWRYDCTGCCARNGRIQRSFASRVACGCPWSARARPKELIGCSRTAQDISVLTTPSLLSMGHPRIWTMGSRCAMRLCRYSGSEMGTTRHAVRAGCRTLVSPYSSFLGSRIRHRWLAC